MIKKLNSRGDTLVEVMIAVAILSFILAASYTLTSYAARVGQSAKERTQAVAYAQQQAEILQAYAARDWPGLAGSLPAPHQLSYFDSNWELKLGELEYPADEVAANYKVSTTLVERVCVDLVSCNEIKQLKFHIDVTWESATAPTDGSGGVIRDKTRLVVKVSPPGLE